MSRTPVLLACLFALSTPAMAGKKSKDKNKDKSASAEEAPASVDTQLPDDNTSKKFGDALMAAEITDFRPVDNVGAKFVYSTMSFDAGNTWRADGYVEIQDERMECVESGAWSIEPAESNTVATVSWTVDKTDCAGRDAGQATRAQVTIEKNGISALFR